MSDQTQLYQFDDIDQRIIALLKRKGRASNQQIAREMDITAGTVSARIQRMEKMNALRVVAVSDFAVHDLDTLISIGVSVEGRCAEAVANDLAAFDEVFNLHLVTGRHDIEMSLVLRGTEGLSGLLKRLAKVPGIARLEAGLVVDIPRFEFDMIPRI